jgi:hypothetical protein
MLPGHKGTDGDILNLADSVQSIVATSKMELFTSLVSLLTILLLSSANINIPSSLALPSNPLYHMATIVAPSPTGGAIYELSLHP